MKIYFVDAFTDQQFKGNQAAVCIVDRKLKDEQMQNIAMEIGFSETAFVKEISNTEFEIRFFTPKKELPLCGHATLAAAKVIFEYNDITGICFINNEGVKLNIERDGVCIKMRFPAYDVESTTVSESMLTSLGITTVNNVFYSPQFKIITIEIPSVDHLQSLAPDFTKLKQSHSGINGVLVTAKANGIKYDFHYRYFWPWAGTNEDPVTGGVQSFLTGYWVEKLNKKSLFSFQSSARTGYMRTEFSNNAVFIYGEAVIILEGTLKLV
ncbi:MAG: PhzF family phenazine biosynthesis protein [Chitinophagaceae bacterium]|nr:PhzF family phenazine biosynthesis protein [Chitinophagaceae bacterium]